VNSQAFTKESSTLEAWNKEAETNIRLLPQYNNAIKTKHQLDADKQFIQSELAIESDRLKASNKYIDFGFNYLYRNDVKTAMYRFNQAYLLDSTNVLIYWGYGAVYMQLDDLPRAKTMYETGLKIAPNSPELLTDFATYYMKMSSNENNSSFTYTIDTAIQLLKKAYEVAPRNENTLYKLSVCYYYLQNCSESKKYLQLCKDAGGQPIDNEFEIALNEACK